MKLGLEAIPRRLNAYAIKATVPALKETNLPVAEWMIPVSHDAVWYDAALADALRHPARIQILMRLARDDESVPSLAESMKATETEVTLTKGMVGYHLEEVLHHQLGLTRRAGWRRIRGTESPVYGVNWKKLGRLIHWVGPGTPQPFLSAGEAFDQLIDEYIKRLEVDAFRLEDEAVLAWFQARIGEIDGRLTSSLLWSADRRVRLAARTHAKREVRREAMRGAIVVATFGTSRINCLESGNCFGAGPES